ncbi:MAG: EAL domain-containing protein [Pseudomonadales bacterium]|nr:EAL domain-containing protein [Pseudomonadales bacterium]
MDSLDLDLDLDVQSLDPGDAAQAAALTAPVAAQLDRVSILLAHENPERGEATKAIFKDASWSTHCHRVTSIEDLGDSLQQQPWDMIIAYADSSLFMPAVIGKQIEQAGACIRSIYLDDSYSSTNALQITQCGFHDYLTEQEHERLLFAVQREALALKNERTALSSESVLAEAEAKSKLLLDSTADAIAYVADGMLIHANNVFVEQLGFNSVEDIELQPFMDFVAKDDESQIRKILRQLDAGASDLPDTQLKLVDAGQNERDVEIAFATASHDGESCTQIILRGAAAGGSTNTAPTAAIAERDTATPSSTDAGPAAASPAAVSIAIDTPSSLHALAELAGKGMMYFVSLCNVANFRAAMDFNSHTQLLQAIQEKIASLVPDNAHIANYAGENWVIAVPESETGAEASLGREICNAIDPLISTHTGAAADKYTAIGISKYGIADLSAQDAIEKSFNVCASQLKTGGFKVFAPRIDNAQGSAALRSAMELDRLKIKYQPIIGLHNQSTQWYEAFIFMRNDAGIEQDASALVDSLGIEKDNVALDQWLVNEAISALSSLVYENSQISLTVPLTSSAVASGEFAEWLLATMQASSLPKDCLSFSITAEQGQDYEAQSKALLTKLLENGFKSTITDVGSDQLAVVKACRPDYVQLHTSFTEKLNAEEDNTKEALKSAISQAGEMDAVCIATGVNTAADLAQLWQTGIPYVQGTYLQAPLGSMSYEFSDIA